MTLISVSFDYPVRSGILKYSIWGTSWVIPLGKSSFFITRFSRKYQWCKSKALDMESKTLYSCGMAWSVMNTVWLIYIHAVLICFISTHPEPCNQRTQGVVNSLKGQDPLIGWFIKQVHTLSKIPFIGVSLVPHFIQQVHTLFNIPFTGVSSVYAKKHKCGNNTNGNDIYQPPHFRSWHQDIDINEKPPTPTCPEVVLREV